MKVTILILLVVTLAFFTNENLKKLKEKQFFGGKTEKEVLKIIRDAWKPIFLDKTEKMFLSLPTDDSQIIAIQEKADANGKTYEEQVKADALYLFNSDPINRHPFKGSPTDWRYMWRIAWLKGFVKRMGLDIQDPKVIEMMKKV